MLGQEPEFIWQGRIHIGDEPGVFGDAFYAGLCAELPITLERISTAGPDVTTLILETQGVRTFTGYPGHVVTVTLYEPDVAEPLHWNERVLEEVPLTTADNDRKEIDLDLDSLSPPHYLSIRIRIDTDVQPGLYDDFVVTRLANRSEDFKFVASFGFRA